jgi:hypothetical protein
MCNVGTFFAKFALRAGQHEKNVGGLRENRSFLRGMQGKGSVREGASLLQGIVVCGACGRHMRVSYDAWGNHSYYCRTYETNRPCQWLRGESIDKTVEKAVLDKITGEELHVALKVFEKIAERAQELDNQWQKRIEAARYEADRAARRYYQVDPDNRLVARTLERDWNDKLAQVYGLPKPWWSNAKIAVRIQELVPEHTDEEIAAILNQEGYRSSTGQEFTKLIVASIRSRHGLQRTRREKDE